jgi:hypothetical protein
MLRALFPQAVFMPTQQSLHATVKLHSQYYHTDVQALVDSGATVTDRLQCVRLVTSGSIGPGVLPNKEGCLAVQGDESKWEWSAHADSTVRRESRQLGGVFREC